MLGGADTQVHAIERAIGMGLEVITCDNRPGNPGHRIAHRSYTVSTTDVEGVLQLSRELEIDGILAYASDPGALTAAYVADRLSLPGDPLDAVRRAQDKLLLRTAQRAAGLPTPEYADTSDDTALAALVATCPGGIIVKPVDSSGSKGVTAVHPSAGPVALKDALQRAFAASRSGRTIAEGLWGVASAQFGGDVLVVDGQVLLGSLYDQVLSRCDGGSIPIGLLMPTSAPECAMAEAMRQTQVLISTLGLRGGVYNVEFRRDTRGVVTIIDFGARIGGNLSALGAQLYDGVDLAEASILLALGLPVPEARSNPSGLHVGRLVVHSMRPGVLSEVRLHPDLESMSQHVMISVRPGDPVRPYRTSADRLGIVVMASTDRRAIEAVFARPESFVEILLRGDLT